MTKILTQVIDPAVLCRSALPCADDFSGVDALLKSHADSWDSSYDVNHFLDPSNNAVINTMDDLGANLASLPPQGSNSFDLHGDTQLGWPMINTEPMADESPQPVNYTSTSNLPMDVYATGEDGMVPIVGPSRLTLPSQVSGPTPAQALPQDPKSKANPKKRRRKRKAPLSPVAEELKREKFLERNRVAANRCREKKKKHIRDVEERRVELQRINVRLRAEKECLVKEIESMTRVLLSYGSCACREDVKRLVKELAASGGANGGMVDWERGHDEIEESDMLTERNSIFFV